MKLFMLCFIIISSAFLTAKKKGVCYICFRKHSFKLDPIPLQTFVFLVVCMVITNRSAPFMPRWPVSGDSPAPVSSAQGSVAAAPGGQNIGIIKSPAIFENIPPNQRLAIRFR